MPLRVGVIGVGAMGENHVRNWSQMPVELVGVCDLNRDRAVAVAAKYGTRTFSSSAALLSEVEAVTVSVPTTLHRDFVLEALQAGVHVLVEKPIAATLEEAGEMEQAAADARRILMVGHLERMNPAVQASRQYVREGRLGEVVSLTAKRVGPHNPRIRDVGVMLDLGIHDIDVISYVSGEPVLKVYAIGGKRLHPFEDYALICLSLPNGHFGVIETNWLTPKKVRTLVLVGTKGVIEVDYPSQSARLLLEDSSEDLPVEKKEPLRAELEAFFLAVTGEGPVEIPAHEGTAALRAALAAVQSFHAGMEVCL